MGFLGRLFGGRRRPAEMDETAFWRIVGDVHRRFPGDMDAKSRAIQAAVARLPASEAIAFGRIFDAMMDRAYAWPLWGAAFVIRGGCGDDAFTDFRSTLISRGREAYEAALADPDSLVDHDIDAEVLVYEGYQYAVTEGVQRSAGRAVPRDSPAPTCPSGEEWAEQDLSDLFPRLWAKYG